MAIVTEIEEEVVVGHASSSGTSSYRKYDVFINFRGEDTRFSFTDHLYEALIKENIDTFMDDEEIKTGEDLKLELEMAIKSSKASIIVLSRNYASSTWCLDELVIILDQRRTCGHIVLPIFYHVEPTHVRKQENSFGEALAKHLQRMEAETDEEERSKWSGKIQQWKEALKEVSNLKGMDVKGKRETVFIQEIIKEIGSRLDLHLRGTIPHLIGRRYILETITSWLHHGTSQILTIWGMAGIGKTTLAKYIFDFTFKDFESSCFLEDIERKCTSQQSGLLDLQNQLLEDIGKKRSSIPVRDVNVATTKIEKKLSNYRMLLVLDGIDNYEQLNALLGKEGFHPGTKIIITTKDRSLLKKCDLFSKQAPPQCMEHLLEGLNETESLQLLCWHAFSDNDPKEGYEEVSEKVLKYCDGHPLAIKVLGSSLRCEDLAAWEDTLILLQKEVNIDIVKVLQMSFDALPTQNDKVLFKHIACFFVGKDREFTETVLKASGIVTSFGISKLINRCLLTIGPGNSLMMHQLLQEMGRDVVRQESPTEPWKRSLLWCHEESFNVLKEEKGTNKIQGLALDMRLLDKQKTSGFDIAQEQNFGDDHVTCLFGWVILLCSSFYPGKFDLKTDGFSKMDSLKLLKINYAQLKGSYKNFPKGLRWLCWRGCPSKYIPQDLPMGNLVALDLSQSRLERLWKKPIPLRSLKILDASYAFKLVRTGDLSGLSRLERLILVGCINLVEVCESVGKCAELVLLDLSDCRELKKLPRSIGNLKKLRIFSVDGCRKFTIEMNGMESLEVLNANNINIVPQATFSARSEIVRRNPRSLLLSLPRSLVKLSLQDNNLCNESFPADFSSLSMLEELYLGGNPISSLPDYVRSLSRLKYLNLDNCEMLKSVLGFPSAVERLNMFGCDSVEKVTFHPELSLIPPQIYHSFSDSLTEIEGVFKYQDLATVDADILSSLGWTDMSFPENCEMLANSTSWSFPKKLPIQMIYEFGIFSTCFPGAEIPNWFSHKTMESSISFTVASSSKNHKIQGLNVYSVYLFSSIFPSNHVLTRITNKTKNLTWEYEGDINVRLEKAEEELVWLSHWMFGKNELEGGDEVSISIPSIDARVVNEREQDDEISISVPDDYAWVKEWGISLVYKEDNEEQQGKENDSLDYYKSWRHIIGGDLSIFIQDGSCFSLTSCLWNVIAANKEI